MMGARITYIMDKSTVQVENNIAKFRLMLVSSIASRAYVCRFLPHIHFQ